MRIRIRVWVRAAAHAQASCHGSVVAKLLLIVILAIHAYWEATGGTEYRRQLQKLSWLFSAQQRLDGRETARHKEIRILKFASPARFYLRLALRPLDGALPRRPNAQNPMMRPMLVGPAGWFANEARQSRSMVEFPAGLLPLRIRGVKVLAPGCCPARPRCAGMIGQPPDPAHNLWCQLQQQHPEARAGTAGAPAGEHRGLNGQRRLERAQGSVILVAPSLSDRKSV